MVYHTILVKYDKKEKQDEESNKRPLQKAKTLK